MPGDAGQMTRREALRVGAGGLLAASGVLGGGSRAAACRAGLGARVGEGKAEACIFIYLPGGVAQTDTWDPKAFTPYRAGMRGSELLGTCESIPTAADGVRLGAGLERMAGVMDRGCVLRSLSSEVKFGAVHLRAQHYLMTGYVHPAGFKAPSLGAIVGRVLGRRDPRVPEYIYIGRDIDTSDNERLFIAEYIGPGFLGVESAPFMIPDPAAGLATLSPAAGMTTERVDRRLALWRRVQELSDPRLMESPRAAHYARMLEDAREMMDSPVKRAFDLDEEKPETLAAYEPGIGADGVMDRGYYFGNRFGRGLLLARRLVESGARFVQVEYQYGPFKGFDMHEQGATRMAEMKRQIDGPIARLVMDLDERGLLDRTLVVIGTEFGRTIASAPAAGTEPEGFGERHTGEDLVIENEKMYGFHGHFSSCSAMLFFGGGFRQGIAYGRTADRHPMVAVERPVSLMDAHATIYHALGIPPDTSHVTEGRPVYVTKDGKGKPVMGLLA